MGIIISSFIGCGREYLKNTHGKKAKIFDAIDEIPLTDIDGATNQDFLDECYNKVMSVVDDYDIVFIPSIKGVRRKRTKPDVIRKLDKHFEEWVNEIDDDESPNCYKHKLSKQGEFIGNEPTIMGYINSLNNA